MINLECQNKIVLVSEPPLNINKSNLFSAKLFVFVNHEVLRSLFSFVILK